MKMHWFVFATSVTATRQQQYIYGTCAIITLISSFKVSDVSVTTKTELLSSVTETAHGNRTRSSHSLSSNHRSHGRLPASMTPWRPYDMYKYVHHRSMNIASSFCQRLCPIYIIVFTVSLAGINATLVKRLHPPNHSCCLGHHDDGGTVSFLPADKATLPLSLRYLPHGRKE